MSKLSNLVAFIIGAAIGSASTWYLVKKKYEHIAQEEIDSVKEVFSKRENVEPEEPEEDKFDINKEDEILASFAREKPSVSEYAKKLSEQGYTDYSKVETSSDVDEEPKKVYKDSPYVIAPEEFDEIDGYDTISLTYYSDRVLTDENDEVMEDYEDVIGIDSLSHFGEYEDDSVFVRNDRLKCDYEILLDRRRYSDILEDKPYLRGSSY